MERKEKMERLLRLFNPILFNVGVSIFVQSIIQCVIFVMFTLPTKLQLKLIKLKEIVKLRTLNSNINMKTKIKLMNLKSNN